MTLSQIAEATGSIKTLFDLARRARELAKKEANAELRGMLLDLQEKAQDVREENQQLRNMLKELENKLRIRDEMDFDGKVYWFKQEQDAGKPFCPVCFDRDEKRIHLHAQGGDHGLLPHWQSKACGNNFPRP